MGRRKEEGLFRRNHSVTRVVKRQPECLSCGTSSRLLLFTALLSVNNNMFRDSGCANSNRWLPLSDRRFLWKNGGKPAILDIEIVGTAPARGRPPCICAGAEWDCVAHGF